MTSFISRIEHFAGTQPRAVAFSHAGGRLAFGEMWEGTRAAAACLYDRGVRAGDTAALAFDRRAETAVPALKIFYALGYLGAVVLPLHPEAHAAGRSMLTARFNAKWIVSFSAAPISGNAAPIDAARLDWERARSRDIAPRGDEPDRPFLYVFTSGTTGNPKVCLLESGRVTGNRPEHLREVEAGPGGCLAGPLPWPTKAGMRSLMAMQAAGGAFCNMSVPETRHELADLVRDFGVTQLWCSPWQLRRLLAREPWPDAQHPALRALRTGGAFLSAQDVRAARETITPNAWTVYAATELGLLAQLPPGEMPAAQGHIGRLLPEVEGHAVDELDRVLPPGRVGRLRFRMPTMPRGYVDNPQANAQCFRDGWFYPGDLGEIDAAGNLTLRGRADDVINAGGAKIVPEAIEAILAQHPDIADVAVVGIPHPMAGEVAVAFAVFRRTPTPESLERFCRDRIDEMMIPREFVPTPGIPRNPDGKNPRSRLRDAYLAARAAQPGSG